MAGDRFSYNLDSTLETVDKAEQTASRIASENGFDEDEVMQIAMAVRADRPVVDGGARCDGLDMDEIEGLVVRRIAVEVEQRERSGRHRQISSCARGYTRL